MDQNILVRSGHALVLALDNDNYSPRVAMWVHNTDTDTWKLWLVPPKGVTNKQEFYRIISSIASKNHVSLDGIDASDTEMILDTHPAIIGLSRVIKAPGLNSIIFRGNRFNNYYLPDGIILRVNL